MGGRVARVLLNTPLPQLDHLFDYAIPDTLAALVDIGSLVSVPLRGGSRFTDAYVIEIVDTSDFSGQLQAIEKVVSGLPILQSETFALARRIADRQAGSVIDVLRLAIPARYVRTEKSFIVKSLIHEDVASNMHPPAVTVERPTAFSDFQPERGEKYVVTAEPTIAILSTGETVPSWAVLFASLATKALEMGQSSVLVVPDFRDVGYIETALVAAGAGGALLRVDANLSGPQRYENYLRATASVPVVILGNRSAALSPAHNLGLIALWDDADDNFVEPLAPYCHARDVALLRQQQSQCSLVFAANSMSTESARLVSIGFAGLVESSRRYRPRVVLADQSVEDETRPARIPAAVWLGAKNALENGAVLFQVSTPGFAPALVCSTCRELGRCAQCAGPLKLPHRDQQAACTWCGQLASGWLCRACGDSRLVAVGSGSERTADEIGRAFPGVPVIVADGSHVVTHVANKPSIIVSTPGAEPLADGGYAAVVILDGERLRMRESLRVNEDALRKWVNAAALGREGSTVYAVGAGNELGAALFNWNLHGFAVSELRDRQALRLPPAARIATVSGHTDSVSDAVDHIRGIDSVRIIGPIGIGGGVSRALVTCDYRVAEKVANVLRAEIIKSATNARRTPKRDDPHARQLRLKVRFDDPSIDNLG